MVLTKRTKVEIIPQNYKSYNVIDGIKFKAEAKRFTHKTMQKEKSHVIFPRVIQLDQSGIKTQVFFEYLS